MYVFIYLLNVTCALALVLSLALGAHNLAVTIIC